MSCYIRSVACISPFSHPADSPYSNALVCADPDLNHLIDAKLTRRMSHVIKMGIGAAMHALAQAGLQQPDAIITGTAYGCLDDTGVFLKKQVQQNETMLTPTAFIQSTHNTVGGQIGLMLHCHAYNNTFVHRGFSFEHALQDAMLLLEEGNANHVLAGAVDELTATSHAILNRFGIYKQFNNELPAAKGTIAGEGAAFFVLSSQPSENDYACLKNVTTLFKPSVAIAQAAIAALLDEHGLTPDGIDIIVAGKNADEATDKIYDDILLPLFDEKDIIHFKNESGEYPTAAAIGLYKAAAIAKQKQAVNTEIADSPVKHILIYNHYQNIHHSIYLIGTC